MRLGKDLIAGVSITNVTGITGKKYSLADLMRAAREAEAMGFDAVWIHDGMTGRRTVGAYDPMSIYAAVAAQTKRIHLCTGILIPQIRNPIHLAQQWATMWEISEGRAILGAGTGAGKDRIAKRQFEALAALKFGTKLESDALFAKRARLFSECLDVIRRLWREDKISYRGEFYEFDEITLGLARPQTPPPILVGGGIYIPRGGVGAHHYMWNPEVAGTFVMGPQITKAVADHGEGWLFVHASLEEMDRKWAEILEHGKKHPGRSYTKAMNVFMNVDNDRRKAWEGVKAHLLEFHGPPVADDTVDRWAAAGSGEEIANKLNAYVDRGVSTFQFVVASSDQFGMMKKIADEVLPRLKRSIGNPA
jgi:alkanesulfonate monooxygenase SsuD/methylene tetrahydromethanopterin reductase-like flavin-dependent oxidoreductase (luciferase family)